MPQFEQPTDGEVFEVSGSPGPATWITITVVVRGRLGDEFFYDVQPFGLPEEFDVYIRVGSPVVISWRGNEPRFAVAWLPVTTECV